MKRIGLDTQLLIKIVELKTADDHRLMTLEILI